MSTPTASLATLTGQMRRLSPLRRWVGMITLRRSRHRLGQLDDHLLRDIGIHPDHARIEAARPIWDVPPTWRR
jgi:uncharacterized protein YjiS (DUF1127 family)